MDLPFCVIGLKAGTRGDEDVTVAPAGSRSWWAVAAGVAALLAGVLSALLVHLAAPAAAVPTGLGAAIATASALQGLVGRRDPRLARAPMRSDDDSIPFE